MKIVIVNKHKQDSLGGSEIQCDIIARELSGRGHEVIYAAVGGEGKYNCGYRVMPVENDGVKIGDAAVAQNPDIIYWRLNKHGFREAAGRIGKAGIPLVFAVSHISDTRKWGAKAVSKDKHPLRRMAVHLYLAWLNRREHAGFRHVRGVVVNNREFLNLLPVSRQAYIPSSVENRAEPFSWPRPFVCWVSALKPSKRPEFCIDLARALDGKGVDLLMAGQIQKESYSWFEDPGRLPDNLHYLGKLAPEKINGMIHESLCLVHTCEPEGFPNIFMQAWRQGKPVVSFGYDPDEVIRTHKLGFVSGGKMDTFAGDVSRLISDPATAEKLGGNGLAFAQKNFTPEKNVARLEEFFRSMVDDEEVEAT